MVKEERTWHCIFSLSLLWRYQSASFTRWRSLHHLRQFWKLCPSVDRNQIINVKWHLQCFHLNWSWIEQDRARHKGYKQLISIPCRSYIRHRPCQTQTGIPYVLLVSELRLYHHSQVSNDLHSSTLPISAQTNPLAWYIIWFGDRMPISPIHRWNVWPIRYSYILREKFF